MPDRKTVRIAVAFVLAFALLCACVQALADSEPALRFENDEIIIPVKKTAKASPVTENVETPKALKFKWTSSDEQIATVQNGTIRGIAAGEATITCNAEMPEGKELSASLKVQVVEPVKTIKIDTKAKTPVNVGETLTVDYTILPENATDKSLTWTSSDPEIATVDGTGTVTAVSAGMVTVTATTNDGSKKQAKVLLCVPSLRCETEHLTVTKPEGASFDVDYFGADWEKDVTVKATGKSIQYQTEKNGNKVTVHVDGGTFDNGKIEFKDKKDPASKVTVDVDIYPDEDCLQGVEYMREEKFYSAYSAFQRSSSELAREKEKECLQPWPKDGIITKDPSLKGRESELVFKINLPDDYAMLIKLVKDGQTVANLFVGGTGTARIPLPSGVYTIKDGSGKQWFGLKEAFGPEGTYETMTFGDDETEVLLEKHYRSTISVNVESLDPGAEAVGTLNEGWEGFSE